MIGQTRLISQLKHQMETNKLPQFIIFTGSDGCGKHTIVEELFKSFLCVGTSVDGVHEMIQKAYTYKEDVTFCIFDADNMSQAALNALLKLVEEPPTHVRVILTCENIENILSTIRSRAVVYQFDPYTYEDKCDFCDERNIVKDEFILDTAETPGDIEKLSKYEGFMDFVDTVINNIASVSGSNAFKIAENIALKETDTDKYDFRLFLMVFSSRCIDLMLNKSPENCLKFSNAVAITGETIADLNIRGINKQMLFDNWLLKIRGIWM